MSAPSRNNLEYASLVSNWESANQPVNRPTIFDILAQETMHSLFKSAFDHFFKWVTSQFAVLSRFKRFGDEIYLAIHSSVEFLYLKAYNALFSEYFYSMKREPIIKTASMKAFSALFSIIVPYLKSKMDHYYEELEKNIEGQQTDLLNMVDPNISQTHVKILAKKTLLRFYPYFHLLWTVTFWFYRIRYMIKKTDFHSPIMSALGHKLVYDTRLVETFSFQTLRQNFLKTILYLTNHVFTASLYFLQFLRWHQDHASNQISSSDMHPNGSAFSNKEIAQAIYEIFTGRKPKKGGDNDDNDEDENEDDQVNGEKIPPPPELPEKLTSSKHFKMLCTEKSGMCPLCSSARTNECVLAVSGFVFCYPCIFKFVRENRRCPITSFPCSTKSIIRIYGSSEN